MAETSNCCCPSFRFFISQDRPLWGERSRNPALSVVILRQKKPSLAKSKRSAELEWSYASRAPKHLRKVARARVAHLQRNLDDALFRFTEELLGASNSLTRDKLQRRHAGG